MDEGVISKANLMTRSTGYGGSSGIMKEDGPVTALPCQDLTMPGGMASMM
jgi:hypothetical protein